MVRRPAEAMHEASGLSYGILRQRLNSAHDDAAVAAMGCSSSSKNNHDGPAIDGMLQCRRILVLAPVFGRRVADFGVNETYCNGLNLELACVDPNNVVWDGIHATAGQSGHDLSPPTRLNPIQPRIRNNRRLPPRLDKTLRDWHSSPSLVWSE
jgi:hypothetical protein